MARRKTGSTEGEAVTPEAETVDAAASPEAPAPEPIQDSAEPAVATDTGATPGSPEFGAATDLEAATDIEPAAGDPDAAPTDPEDAAILASVDEALAKGGAEPAAEPFDPPRPRAPTDAAEDAEILASVDAAIASERAEYEPWSEIDSPSESETAEPARRPEPAEPAHRPEPPATFAPTAPAAASGGSVAGRLLAALLLLLVGFGLALWAAPRLAPRLPAGMAAWVSPAGSDVAALKGEVEGLKSQLATLSGGLDAQIKTATDAAATRLEGEIAAFKTELGTTDSTSLRQRLDRLDAAAQGQTAELDTLKQQLTGATGTGSAQIDVYRGEIDGLRGEMGALSDKVAALATRVDEVGAEASRQIDTARAKVAEVQQQASTATLQADLAEIQAAIAAGQPFAAPLDRLAGTPGISVPEPLKAAANDGIPSLAQLRDGFPDAAHQAIRASIRAASGGGLLDRAGAFLRSEVATRSLTPQPGRSPDAVLSRMEDKLRNDDLAGALAESGQLPTEALAAMSGWLDAAKLRASAEAGLATLSAALPATN